MLTVEELAGIDRKVLEEIPIKPWEDKGSGWFCAEKSRAISDTRELIRKNMIRDFELKKNTMTKRIFDVNIEIDHPAFKAARTNRDIMKIGVFDHLSEGEQEQASAELLKVLAEKNKAPKQVAEE